MKSHIKITEDTLILVADESGEGYNEGEELAIISINFYKYHYSDLIRIRQVKRILLKYFYQFNRIS